MTDHDSLRTVTVVGLGKLGAPVAATFAAKGHRVFGVDADPERVALVQAGRAPVFEPGLEEQLAAAGPRLVATTDCRTAVLASELTFILVPTPSEPDGGFSLRFVLAACDAIGQALGERTAYHVVVVTSTVMPGHTMGEVRARLEARSGKRCGRDFGLCYGPEFVALGSVIRNVLAPDFVLIGESDEAAGSLLTSFYRTVCENRPPVARMSPVNAEITKLAVNTFVTTKITFANMLARLCESLPGADVDAVTGALGLDSRIGRKYLRGAIGYGGPCFPRDNLALTSVARRQGIAATLAEATDAANRQQVEVLASLVRAKLPPGGRVGILGLAYKPETDVVEESPGLLLARALLAHGVAVVAYDPVAMEGARRALPAEATFAPALEACVAAADVLVVTTPWEVFRGLGPEQLARPGRPRVVIDCWRILDAARCRAAVDYVAIGVGEPA